MAVKKSELYSAIWASCDALRGGMDASIYKGYVLMMLVIEYNSLKHADVPYTPIAVPVRARFNNNLAPKGKSTFGDIH